MDKAVHALVFDGLADWEPALLLAALRDAGSEVRTVGFDRQHVTSAAGLRIVPDLALAELDVATSRLFVMPGGDSWQSREYPVPEVERTLSALLAASVPVAAICGATVALARAGVFAERAHTSNDARWLKAIVPDYRGQERYRDELAVRDRGVITAAGSAPVEFAREVLSELASMPEPKLSQWFTLFKTGRLPEGVDPAQLFGT